MTRQKSVFPKNEYYTQFDFTDKKAYYVISDKSRSVQHPFFEPQDTKLKCYQDKIHLI